MDKYKVSIITVLGIVVIVALIIGNDVGKDDFSKTTNGDNLVEMLTFPPEINKKIDITHINFNKFDWDGAQVPTDIRKSFMNSKKIVKQLYLKRNGVAKILLEEYKTGIVFHSPKTKIPNNTQEQKLVKKLGIKELTDELFEDNNIISVQFLNNGSIDIFFKQDKKDGVIYDRYVGCGEADEIVTEYSEIRRIYGNWFYTYSCLDYYSD